MNRPGDLAALALALAVVAACQESPTGSVDLAGTNGEALRIDEEGVVLGPVPRGLPPGETSSGARSGPALRSSLVDAAEDGAVVLPALLATALGNQNNTFPHARPDMRYQQLFSGSEINGPRTFRELCLRPDDVFPSPTVVQSLTVKLGPTDLDPASIGAGDFDANYSAPPTTVFAGSFEMPATGVGGLDDWVACLTFTTPFEYAGGNLIVEMINSSPDISDKWVADFCSMDFGQEGCNTSRVVAFDSLAAAPDFVFRNSGLAMRLSGGVRTLQVGIDVGPGNERNRINLRSRGAVLVALLGSETFEVGELDVATPLFGPPGAPNAMPRHDLVDPAIFADHLRDVNGDGFVDLLLHFGPGEAGFDTTSGEGCLEGATVEGVPLRGCDAVTVVRPGRPRR